MERNREREEALRQEGLLHCHKAAEIIENSAPNGLMGRCVEQLVEAYRACDGDHCDGNGIGAVMISLAKAGEADAVLALLN